MATPAVQARPVQALRQRRESARPGLARVSTRAITADAIEANNAHNEPTPYGMIHPFDMTGNSNNPPSHYNRLYPSKVCQQSALPRTPSPPDTFPVRPTRWQFWLQIRDEVSVGPHPG